MLKPANTLAYKPYCVWEMILTRIGVNIALSSIPAIFPEKMESTDRSSEPISFEPHRFPPLSLSE